MRVSNVFGISFCNVLLEKLGQDIIDGVYDCKIVVTPNVDHIVRFHHDSSFKKIYKQADLFVNDSRILKKLSAFGLEEIESLVPGSDLTKWIFENSPKDLRITIIGASSETIDIVRDNYNITVVNHYNPPMGFIDSAYEVDKCIEYCNEHPSDIYFLAVGSPRQELLAIKLKSKGLSGAFLCVGASLLFLSGEEMRAPLIIQKLNMEWLFRLLMNPRRLYKRYLLEGPKIFKIYLKERVVKVKK